jgi:hypothetical protein
VLAAHGLFYAVNSTQHRFVSPDMRICGLPQHLQSPLKMSLP